MYENIITPPPKINELKLATYEAAATGEITEGEKNRLLWEIETRELSITESAIDEELSSLNADLDYLMLEYETSTILVESGDTYVYESKAKQIEQKSKGILSRIISAVKALFTKLKNWLTGKKVDPKNAPKSIKVEATPSKLKTLANKISKHASTIIAASGMIVATGAAVHQGVKNSKTQKELNTANETIDNQSKRLHQEDEKLQRAAQSAATKQQEIDKMGKELKDLTDAFQDSMKKESIYRDRFQSTLDEYADVMSTCEKYMDDINSAVEKNDISDPKMVTQLKTDFIYFKNIYLMTQTSAKQLLSAVGDPSGKAEKLINKKTPNRVIHPSERKNEDTYGDLKNKAWELCQKGHAQAFSTINKYFKSVSVKLKAKNDNAKIGSLMTEKDKIDRINREADNITKSLEKTLTEYGHTSTWTDEHATNIEFYISKLENKITERDTLADKMENALEKLYNELAVGKLSSSSTRKNVMTNIV